MALVLIAALGHIGCAIGDDVAPPQQTRPASVVSPPATVQPATAPHAKGAQSGHAKPPKVESGVTSMDVYADPRSLHLLTANRTLGQPPIMHYQSSDDAGATWTAPVRVGEEQAPPEVARRGMDVQIAAAGDKRVAVWTTFSEASRFGRGPLAAAHSSDAGRTWTASQNPADDGADSDHAFIDLAADERGTFHLVWLDAREGQKGLIYATSSDGASWSKNRTLLPATCECCWNTLLATPRGNISVLYRQKSPRDMGLISSADNGNSWTAPVTVGAFGWNVEACPHVGGGLALLHHAGKQSLFATVWTAHANVVGGYLLKSTDGGATWAEPKPLGPGAWHTDVATAGTGAVATVWDAYTDDGQGIFASLSTDGGDTFSAPRRLTDPTVSATHPRVAGTPDGFRVFYTETPEDGKPRWVVRELR